VELAASGKEGVERLQKYQPAKKAILSVCQTERTLKELPVFICTDVKLSKHAFSDRTQVSFGWKPGSLEVVKE
jgi:hypothetical protein